CGFRARWWRPAAHDGHTGTGRRGSPAGLSSLGEKMITPEFISEHNAPLEDASLRDVAHAHDVLEAFGVDAGAVIAQVARFSVAAPSWAVGTGGTRFGRFPMGG